MYSPKVLGILCHCILIIYMCLNFVVTQQVASSSSAAVGSVSVNNVPVVCSNNYWTPCYKYDRASKKYKTIDAVNEFTMQKPTAKPKYSNIVNSSAGFMHRNGVSYHAGYGLTDMVPYNQQRFPILHSSSSSSSLQNNHHLRYKKTYLRNHRRRGQAQGWKKIHEKECDGYENFVTDIELLSLKLGIFAFAKTVFAWLLHILNQTYLFFSIYAIGIPERLLAFLSLFFPQVITAIEDSGIPIAQIETFYTILGLLDYLGVFFGSYPLGNWIVVIDGIAEILTAITLAMAAFGIFADLIADKLKKKVGIDLHEIFDGYACERNKKLAWKEQIFDNFWYEINDLIW